MRCPYCAHEEPSHALACPRPDGKFDRDLREIWEDGYRAGRAGKECMEQTPTYRLGWGRGVVSLEEAQNGCDWRDY